MHHKPLVFLDIETTGGSHVNSRVLEVGAIRVENNEVVGTFNQLLSPEERIPSFITNLTGITDEMTWDSPIFANIADQLRDFLSGAIFVAHNVAFDYNFIKMEYSKIGSTFNMDRLCTVRLSRALYPYQQRHNLDSIIKIHGFNVVDRHRALDDAKVLLDFYNKIVDEHGLSAYAAMNKVMNKARA